jgi:hypothetical protein
VRAPITRSQFVLGAGAVGLGLLAGCGRWPGQAPTTVPKLGFLSSGSVPSWGEAFWEGLRALGYVEGQNITMERRQRQPCDPRALHELARCGRSGPPNTKWT